MLCDDLVRYLSEFFPWQTYIVARSLNKRWYRLMMERWQRRGAFVKEYPMNSFVYLGACQFCKAKTTTTFTKEVTFDTPPRRRVWVFCHRQACYFQMLVNYRELAKQENIVVLYARPKSIKYNCPRSNGAYTLCKVYHRWKWYSDKMRCVWTNKNGKTFIKDVAIPPEWQAEFNKTISFFTRSPGCPSIDP